MSQKRRPGLAHLCVGEAVLVGIVEIFAAHAPDKHVVRSACGGVDRPFGRDDGLFVVEPYDAVS